MSKEKNTQTPKERISPREFLEEFRKLSEIHGYDFGVELEPFLQDNGSYSFKTSLKIIDLIA